MRARSPCTWRRPRDSASPGQPASPPRLCHGEPAARPSAPGRHAVPQGLGPAAMGPGRGAAARQVGVRGAAVFPMRVRGVAVRSVGREVAGGVGGGA